MINSFIIRVHRFSLYITVVLVFLFGILSCTPSGKPTAISETDSTLIPSLEITDTPLPSPTNLPRRVVLLSTDGSNNEDIAYLQSVLTELAEQNGYRFDFRSDLPSMNIDSDVWLVVVVPPDPGILNLAAANSAVQFLAVGITGLQASQNISVIGSSGDRSDQRGFLAGYLAAVITQDWRVGVIAPSDTPSGLAALHGFVNGVIFYCGLCRPAYPPFFQYPIITELPSTAGEAELQNAVDTMVSNAVKTVYVFPGAGDEALLQKLAQAEVNIIGETTPSDQVKNRWVTSIRVDEIAAIKLIWPRLIEGERGISLEVPLIMMDQNTNFFSLGRQHLVEKLLAELSAGFIDTGIDPVTGELR